MAAQSPPLVSTREHEVRDAEAGRELLHSMYAGHRLALSGDPADFRLDVRTSTAGPITIDLLRHTMHCDGHFGPFDDLTTPYVLRGRTVIRTGRDEVRLGPGEVCLDTPRAPLHGWWEDLGVGIVRLPLHLVGSVANETSGVPADDLRFEGLVPVSASMGRYWWGLVRTVSAQMLADESPLNHPLVLAETARMMAVAALHVFPNTTLGLAHVPGPGRVVPAALRRAVAHIDAHADQAITLTEIAAAAGTSARALQHAFARHYETTPTGYLRQVRLERAHTALKAADPTSGDTVAAIAAQWGFGKPSRFAAAYRQRFGVAPSHTLRT